MRNLLQNVRRQNCIEPQRKGAVLVLSAAVLIIVLAFATFTIDIGYIALTKTQLHNAVDAAALAGALELNPTMDQKLVDAAAREAAVDVASLNGAGDHSSVVVDPTTDIRLGRRTWDPSTGTYSVAFGPQAVPYNIVEVRAQRKQVDVSDANGSTTTEDRRLPLFFAPVLGQNKASLELKSMATFQPRDMMLVLDYSASMNDDSELKSIGKLPQSEIESMIHQMWVDLGSPTYGNMGYQPDWVTITGNKATVTWKSEEVYVQGSNVQKVKLYFSNGQSKTYSNPSLPYSYKGSGSAYGKRITKVKFRKDGSWETVDFYNTNTIKRGLGLDTVPYPYPSGSWDNYIDYCRDHNGSTSWYDGDIYTAGYRRKFGMLTLINFWNKEKPKNSQTPDLWKASQQPITALKNSTDMLLNYLIDVESEDQVGLSVYTIPNSPGAKLESSLTRDFTSLKTISRQRQAGHYDYYTNIGAGMRVARLELENNARPKAFRMMVLMTDGKANRSSTSASPSGFCLDEADRAADAKIKIMTISLGLGADRNLMQQIADKTGGIHFNIPGGGTVAEYEAQLKNVFAEIAADRPLKLIPLVN